MQSVNRQTSALVCVGAVMFCLSVNAQVTNGDFVSGTNGWRYVFAPGNHQTPGYGIMQFDVDGAGPLGSSSTFYAGVGSDALMNLEQDVYLVAGVTYDFHADLASIPTSFNADGGTITAFIGPTSITAYAFGSNPTIANRYAPLATNYTPLATGTQTLSIHFSRAFGYGAGNTPVNAIDNISLAPVPVSLSLQRSGTNVVLSWTNSVFKLQGAPQIDAAFTNIQGATSPSTNAISGSQRFFRLIAN